MSKNQPDPTPSSASPADKGRAPNQFTMAEGGKLVCSFDVDLAPEQTAILKAAGLGKTGAVREFLQTYLAPSKEEVQESLVEILSPETLKAAASKEAKRAARADVEAKRIAYERAQEEAAKYE